MSNRIAVLGGDMRQVYLAELFAEDGWDTVTWGLENGGGIRPVPLDEAAKRDILVLPIPVMRSEGIRLPLTAMELDGEQLWPQLHPGQLLLGGGTGELSRDLRDRYGLTLVDYGAREEFQVANAALTAEGAIRCAMERLEVSLNGIHALLLGGGRIARCAALKLNAMGAKVTAAARRPSDRAWMEAIGVAAIPLSEVETAAGTAELIWNTIPAPVLTDALLQRTAEDALIMDLAPCGSEASLKGRVIPMTGLPGKTVPRSAARVIRDSIYRIFEERGEHL